MGKYVVPMGEDDVLFHNGVKGMKWGVRRAAKKDANEYAKAKMFYGEGAGTRRKLIKAKVAERSKDPNYKSEFDRNVANQDYAKRSDQARRERTRKDVVAGTAKTARGIKNTLLGNPQYATVGAIGIGMALKYAHNTGADKVLLEKGLTAARTAANSQAARQGMAMATKLLKGLR